MPSINTQPQALPMCKPQCQAGEGIQAESACSVYLWWSLSSLLCEGRHWVRGFGG